MRMVSVCLPLWMAPAVRAQEPYGPDTDREQHKEEKEPAKKQPSIFHRPAQKTPAAQLAYAQSLEAAGRLIRATRQYLALVHTWHESPEAITAERACAAVLEKRGRYVRAFDEYQYLIDNFAGHFPYEEILDRQLRIARFVSTRRRGKFLFFPGFKSSGDALPLFEKLVQNAPHWEQAPEIQYTLATLYEADGQHELAVQAFEAVEADRPDSRLAATAAYGKADSLYGEARRNRRDEMICRDALQALSVAIRDYPADPQAEVARQHLDEMKTGLADSYYDRAYYYDRIAKRPEAALITYGEFIKQFPTAKQAEEVSRRMEVLKARIPAQGKPQ